MKRLILAAVLPICVMAACNGNPPQPEPEEYFSFDADGKHYDYPQVVQKYLMGSPTQTLQIVSSASSTGVSIRAKKADFPHGSFFFEMGSRNVFNSKDTFDINTISVTILDFNTFANSFGAAYDGKIIITSRAEGKLQGLFNFKAINRLDPANIDTITITNGKFSIKY